MKVSNVKKSISKTMHTMTILSVSNYQIEIIFTTTCTVEITKKKNSLQVFFEVFIVSLKSSNLSNVVYFLINNYCVTELTAVCYLYNIFDRGTTYSCLQNNIILYHFHLSNYWKKSHSISTTAVAFSFQYPFNFNNILFIVFVNSYSYKVLSTRFLFSNSSTVQYF